MRVWPQFAALSYSALIPWLGRLATLAMLALLAWIGAGIFWSLSTPQTPRSATAMETDPQRAVQAIGGRHLFGVAPTVTESPASAPTDLRLSGAIVAQQAGSQSFAVLSIEGRPPQVVREGDEIAPGVTLERVLARQVEILRNGQKQTLSLPESNKGGTGQIQMPGMMPSQSMPSGIMPTMPPQPIPAGQMPPMPNRGNPA